MEIVEKFRWLCRDYWNRITQREKSDYVDVLSLQKIFDSIGKLERDPSPEMTAAVVCHGHIAVGLLLSFLHHSDQNVRVAVARALAEFGDVRAVDDLVVRFDSDAETVTVREQAGLALTQIRHERAVYAVIGVLESGQSSFRWQAAQVLEAIGSMSVRPLIGVLESEDPVSRSMALAVLRKITGKDFGEDIEEWRQIPLQKEEELN